MTEQQSKAREAMKPCPFCGAASIEQDAYLQYLTDGRGEPPDVACPNGHTLMMPPGVWNTRAPSAETAALRQRVEKLEGAPAPFAKAGSIIGERCEYSDFYAYRPAAGDEYAITGDHLRAAKAALTDSALLPSEVSNG